MGTKRKLYREVPEQVIQEEAVEEEDDVRMRDMLIGSVILIILVIIGFLSPNF